MVDEPDQIPCKGFLPRLVPKSRLAKLQAEFEFYMQHTSFACSRHMTSETHKYMHDVVAGTYVIFHRRCAKVINRYESQLLHMKFSGPESDDDHRFCRSCASLATDKSIISNIGTFWSKYMAALLLRAKLWEPETVEAVTGTIKKCLLMELCSNFRRDMEKVLELNLLALQNHVRVSFLSVGRSRQTDSLKFLIASLVLPTVKVSVHSCNEDISKKTRLVALQLASGKLASVPDVDFKLGCVVASGGLRAHPMLHGILLMVAEKLRREKNGVLSFKGLRLTEEERAIVSESAAALAAAAGNKQLLKEFGMLSQKPKVNLCGLLDRGLPDAFCALARVDILRQNALAVDTLLPKNPGAPVRRLCCAFDKTYLLKTINVLQHTFGRGLVGTAWSLSLNILNLKVFHYFFMIFMIA